MEDKITTTPERDCDIVMKGGITSGIVYPKAIYELAKEYRFINVGGTSAGAIAAALTAAAEYDRREHKSSQGFEKLNKIPTYLSEKVSGKSRLLSLFQPNDSTKKIFNAGFHFVEKKKWKDKVIYSFFSLLYNFPLLSIISLLPGLIVVVWSFFEISNVFLLTFIFLFALICSCIIVAITTSIKFIVTANTIISSNNYGLVIGNSQTDDKNEPGLTDWLSETIADISGKNSEDPPLTFRDLLGDESNSEIRLQVITTNLTLRKPHSLPWDSSEYCFDPKEFKSYFPKKIVDWILSKSKEDDYEKGKFWLPNFIDLPILVAVRMSLSFPLLISAVPLYARDYTRKLKPGETNTPLEKCIFSDGGICSNFPIHFFDSPLPSRPTFAFTLDTFHPDYPQDMSNECKNIYLPQRNKDHSRSRWFRHDNTLLSFLSSIWNTAQNWNDSIHTIMPGYRDRIASIHLSSEEGGLNLNMDKEVLIKISERGRCAGEEFRIRFDAKSTHELNWNNHRWTRFRTVMPQLVDYLKKFENVFIKPSTSIEKCYNELLKRDTHELPKSYRFTSNTQKESAISEIKELLKYLETLDVNDKTFKEGNVPSPLPELKSRPII